MKCLLETKTPFFSLFRIRNFVGSSVVGHCACCRLTDVSKVQSPLYQKLHGLNLYMLTLILMFCQIYQCQLENKLKVVSKRMISFYLSCFLCDRHMDVKAFTWRCWRHNDFPQTYLSKISYNRYFYIHVAKKVNSTLWPMFISARAYAFFCNSTYLWIASF